MPYKIRNNVVYKFKNGSWSKKQKTSSHENAVKAVRLLEALEHNPNFKVRRNKRK